MINNIDTVDFCFEPNQVVNDVNIALFPINQARPGFEASYQLVYHNIGTTPLNGSVELNFDNSKLDFLNASETISSQTSNALSFDYNNLNPFETRTIDLTFNVFEPPAVQIGDSLSFSAIVNPIVGNVRVENVLDPNLDWTSLQLENSSDSIRVEIMGGSEVSFIFNNINLPDSTTNEPASHGFIAYKIKPTSNVSHGDIISNQANIFFDFNAPIETNIVNTEIPILASTAQQSLLLREKVLTDLHNALKKSVLIRLIRENLCPIVRRHRLWPDGGHGRGKHSHSHSNSHSNFQNPCKIPVSKAGTPRSIQPGFSASFK